MWGNVQKKAGTSQAAVGHSLDGRGGLEEMPPSDPRVAESTAPLPGISGFSEPIVGLRSCGAALGASVNKTSHTRTPAGTQRLSRAFRAAVPFVCQFD